MMLAAQQVATTGVSIRARSRLIQSTQQRAQPRRGRSLARSCRAAAGVQFGVHANVWEGSWTPEEAKRAIAGTAAAGYDLIEGERSPLHPCPPIPVSSIMAC